MRWIGLVAATVAAALAVGVPVAGASDATIRKAAVDWTWQTQQAMVAFDQLAPDWVKARSEAQALQARANTFKSRFAKMKFTTTKGKQARALLVQAAAAEAASFAESIVSTDAYASGDRIAGAEHLTKQETLFQKRITLFERAVKLLPAPKSR